MFFCSRGRDLELGLKCIIYVPSATNRPEMAPSCRNMSRTFVLVWCTIITIAIPVGIFEIRPLSRVLFHSPDTKMVHVNYTVLFENFVHAYGSGALVSLCKPVFDSGYNSRPVEYSLLLFPLWLSRSHLAHHWRSEFGRS